jgi:hypothetical protein
MATALMTSLHNEAGLGICFHACSSPAKVYAVRRAETNVVVVPAGYWDDPQTGDKHEFRRLAEMVCLLDNHPRRRYS